ncbi:hypothetical protein G9A89_006593 [Geosiphon pyriformis]|nr:hypothetical protein G9A89_006593 [Geosiphon pyriformis]
MVPIKVLIIEATQYQALVGNDWLSKTNALLDWNIKRKRNLLEKSAKFPGLTPNTMSYHQYLHGITTAKESRAKNLSGKPTKSGKLTMTRKNK